MYKKRILVVEDEMIIAKDIKDVLEKLGYEVIEIITSGENAVKTAILTKPDLILMDIMLSKKMTGVEAAGKIRKEMDVPLTYITAYADDNTIEKAISTNPYGYLVKPFEEKEIKVALELAFYKFSMESKLRKSEEKYRTIFENIQDVYIETDLEGKILEISPSIENFTFFKRKKLINTFIQELLTDKKEFRVLKEIILTKNQLFGYEISFKNGRDQEISCSINCKINRDAFRKTKRIVYSMRNITNQKRMEKRILRAERLAGVGQLAAGIAHEIRNPLGNISASIQFCISKYKPDENIKKYLEIVLRNSENANKIIKELLEFATPREINRERKNVINILENTINMVQARCSKAEVEIIRKYSDKIPDISLDEKWIEQSFLNFILNAIEAMPVGGSITIEAKCDKENVLISFQDTGIGISGENLTKIFDPFFTTKAEGTGLGLSLVYQIIIAHEGNIEIESKIGRGTKVKITLPLNQSILHRSYDEYDPDCGR
ncbi:MAG: ATP-binding protein [Candidatus Cloacimonadales bacterium]|nr:ATP-binding protein [Candidatus Cloacimonadales bacterium]